jgi:hypothetical protein
LGSIVAKGGPPPYWFLVSALNQGGLADIGQTDDCDGKGRYKP